MYPSQVEARAIVLRCYNAGEEPTTARWRFDRPVRDPVRVRLDERNAQPLRLEEQGRAVVFEAGPREVVTIRVRRT